MQIWVDADACPVVIKEILCRAAKRCGIELTFIANQFIRVPSAPNIKAFQVPSGFDMADNEIVRRVGAGDLVITSDIPLAAEVIEKGALVLDVRGEKFTSDNIKAKLNMRDFMDTMRSSGVFTGGPSPLGQQERKTFGGHLDKYLSRYQRP